LKLFKLSSAQKEASLRKDLPVPGPWVMGLNFTSLCLILLSEAVISIDRAIKILFRAICMRGSHSAPGSGTCENMAVSCVNTLVGGETEAAFT